MVRVLDWPKRLVGDELPYSQQFRRADRRCQSCPLDQIYDRRPGGRQDVSESLR